jgi:AcrR family transcriptional regulator
MASEDEVIEAGRRVLARDGYEGATLERIATEAGISRVTLHRRGVTKAAIVLQLAERGLERYRRLMWPALTARGTGRERLDQALRAICQAAEEHRELLEALGDRRRDELFHRDGDEALTRDFFTEPLVRLLEDGAQDGSLEPADAEERATVLFNLVAFTYLHLRAGHGWNEDRAADAVVTIALEGVAT